MANKDTFTFDISLSVLDHLGRNLYRSFATVLGEAISNSWDADSKNVYVEISKEGNNFCIKDDGVGMNTDDFQNKFLRIGYSKRRSGDSESKKGRPYIGRKGIGKLALLTCSERITVVSKVKGGSYIGGVIDNSGLDKAITEDLTPQQYRLGQWSSELLSEYMKDHKHGTIIYFEGIKSGIRNSLAHLKKVVALYFRFSLVDKSFNIFINGEKVDYKALNDLAEQTQFLWELNQQDDPYVAALKKRFTKEDNETRTFTHKGDFKGFIASVNKPRDLKIMGTEERVGVDLFVNGRLREHDILKRIPTARLVESYVYGQIHFDALDDDVDRFTSSREGIVADDPKYQSFLAELQKNILPKVIDDWDKWRRKHGKDGDADNDSISRKDRKSEELYNAIASEYSLPKDSKNKTEVDKWVSELREDAQFNFGSYAECFISENLLRKYIHTRKVKLSPEARDEAKKWKEKEDENKNKGNISIDIRQHNNDLMYLSMDHLANLVDKRDPIKDASLSRDAREYKPIRDSMAHTALLTDPAKKKLSTVYENIKSRVFQLLKK